MPRHLVCLMLLATCGASAQDKRPKEPPRPTPEVHNTIELPAAAHQPNDVAGSFTDPLTHEQVYRLSDRGLCPHGAIHIYSFSNQFSPKGRMVFDCYSDAANRNAITHPIYGSDFKLLYRHAEQAAGFVNKYGRANTLKFVQWSLEREVLFGEAGLQILELDPFGGKNRVFADFANIKEVVNTADGKHVAISTAKDMSVGPGDRILVHLQCRMTDAGCPQNWEVVGIGVFDPATRQYHALYVPVPGDKAPIGFDEAQWTLNPAGRATFVYGNAPAYIYTSDLSSRVKMDDNHGHRAYFCGSNGRCYMARVKNDDGPKGGIGQIGCRDSSGKQLDPWRAEGGLYDDETGKRVLIFGCDVPGQNPWQHFATSFGAKDVFGISTDRYTFPPSLQRSYSMDEAIVRAKVSYSAGQPSHVAFEVVAYHRSATGARSKLMGRGCDYWATPRMVMDFTGRRSMFDSTMSHPEWPSTEDGRVKADCLTDVYVAQYAGK